MTPSERSTEYAVRIIAAPLAAVIAAGAVALVLGLICLPIVRFHSTAVYYVSVALQCLAKGFAFVFAGSFVLPGRWRVGGALVLIVIGIAVHMHMMRSYTSDPQPPLWPLFAEIAGGLIAVAVQHIRRPRNES